MLLNKLTLLSLLYFVKEEVCNEVVIELSSASQLSWYMFDLFSVLLFFFGAVLIINWEIKEFVISWHHLKKHISLF